MKELSHLYQVFAQYDRRNLGNKNRRWPEPTEDDDEGDFEPPSEWSSCPVSSIPAESLDDYFPRAMTTQGSLRTFKWVLPRLFEIIINPPDDWYWNKQLLGSKLTYGNWHSWPSKERAAVEQLIQSLWDSALRDYPPQAHFDTGGVDGGIEDWMGFVEAAKLPLQPYLENWSSLLPCCETARRHFLDLIRNVSESLPRGKISCFWDDKRYEISVFRNWFLSPDKLAIIESSIVGPTGWAPDDSYRAAYLSAYRNMVRNHQNE
ncbi:MAG: hypothetical protein H6819_02490 [Phycisphaerales bacterium]|nr:hypothetical protein [Phycisphaerales bacterium]MCB9856919.1 hypothetical protein [Phycisphaerales bacterium]MCB9861954.1 hypothetical protein [Phycisphaerales bacterium]